MEWHSLPPRARWLFHLQALSRYVLFWLPATGVAAVMALPMFSWTTVVGIAAAWLVFQLVWAVWMPSLSWARWAWSIREHDLLVHRGVLIRATTAVPLARIQHVDTRQGPLEQLFGLVRVTVSTASGGGPDITLPGLTRDVAEDLRDRLVVAAGQGDDGV